MSFLSEWSVKRPKGVFHPTKAAGTGTKGIIALKKGTI